MAYSFPSIISLPLIQISEILCSLLITIPLGHVEEEREGGEAELCDLLTGKKRISLTNCLHFERKEPEQRRGKTRRAVKSKEKSFIVTSGFEQYQSDSKERKDCLVR